MMSERPRFKVVEETPYGPRLERIYPAESLAELGDLESNSRRSFLKRMTVLGVSVVASSVLHQWLSDSDEDLTESQSDSGGEVWDNVESSESLEVDENSVRFEAELEGYKALSHLKRDQVLFVDEYNLPVGDPQSLVEYVDVRPNSADSSQTKDYLYTPGEVNEFGVLRSGISGDWLKYVRKKHQIAHPDTPIIRTFHVTADFYSAYKEKDEPELVQGIKNGDIEEYIDIVRYFANKPVVGASEYTRQKYVQEKIVFKDWDSEKKTGIPPIVDDELRRLLPGLCAQESKFNAGLVSKMGAKGILQFMPQTWEGEYRADPDEYTSLSSQVEVAGLFISDLYRQIQVHCGEDILVIFRDKFSDEESFLLDFLVPLTINSYNAGSARMGESVRKYVSEVSESEMPIGKDIFLAIVDHAVESKDGKYLASYGKHAREYVPRIYAQAEELSV